MWMDLETYLLELRMTDENMYDAVERFLQYNTATVVRLENGYGLIYTDKDHCDTRIVFGINDDYRKLKTRPAFVGNNDPTKGQFHLKVDGNARGVYIFVPDLYDSSYSPIFKINERGVDYYQIHFQYGVLDFSKNNYYREVIDKESDEDLTIFTERRFIRLFDFEGHYCHARPGAKWFEISKERMYYFLFDGYAEVLKDHPSIFVFSKEEEEYVLSAAD